MLKDKDIRQRTLGFISFSFLAHLGLIATTFLIPNMLKEVGSAKSETYLIDSPASLGESAQAEPQMAPPSQVTTVPVDETSTIVVAKNDVKAEQENPEAKLVEKKAEIVTKRVLALPAKKPTPMKAAQASNVKSVQTVDQSELQVSQSPEVAADIEVPEVVEDSEATATAVVTSQGSEEQSEAVESATTSASEETGEVVTPVPAKQQPFIAPIQRGAQVSRPAGQVGGLGTAGNVSQGGTAAVGTDGIRDADSLMEQPGNAKPKYADEDQRAGREGIVVFDAMVTREGVVQGIQLKQSSGSSSLDSSAYEAFKKHRYLPGQEGAVRKKFQFVLNGEKTLPGKLRRR